MLRCQFQTAYPRKGILQFLLQIRLIIRKLPAKIRTDFLLLFFIRNNMYPPKHDHAADVQCPFAILEKAPIHNAIADLIILPDGIQLVTLLGTMEIQLSICR